MGTRWENGWELGMVAVTLGLAFGCGGKYAVGSGETGGQGGTSAETGGTSGRGAGGRGGSGQGGNGGLGATDASGGALVAGSSAGGSMAVQCGAPPLSAPAAPLAAPEVVWERLSLFLYGELRDPLGPLPNETTEAWVRGSVRAILAEQYSEEGRAPAGLEDFVRTWAFEGNEDANVEGWASAFARPGGNFASFFDEVGDRVSIMSDRSFLEPRPTYSSRSMWMLETLFCFEVSPPPPEVSKAPIEVPPNKTRRQAVEEVMRSADVCVGCHSIIDPLGFSLEHYDEAGNYRTTENGLPIDASGTSYDFSQPLVWNSIDDLAGQLPGVCEVKTCFANKLFTYALDRAYSGAAPAHAVAEDQYVANAFITSSLALAPLVEAITLTPTFLHR